MLYQKLLLGSKPYYIAVGHASAFEAHRHPEFEISYCLKGSYEILCENRRYTLEPGDFIVIPPVASHQIPPGNDAACQSMTLEFGYGLLGEHFQLLNRQNPVCEVYRQASLRDTSFYREITALMQETAALIQSYSPFDALSIKGNLYKISALLLQKAVPSQAVSPSGKKLADIKKIEQALGIIYNRYFEPLSIEEISASCGYSKSNFCKIFKSITADTFHNTLNRHRVEIACMLLRESSHTVEEIAQKTGFADSKSFCRVFKKLMGKSAGEYRKTANSAK